MLEEGQTNKQESENSKEEILPLELEAEDINQTTEKEMVIFRAPQSYKHIEKKKRRLGKQLVPQHALPTNAESSNSDLYLNVVHTGNKNILNKNNKTLLENKRCSKAKIAFKLILLIYSLISLFVIIIFAIQKSQLTTKLENLKDKYDIIQKEYIEQTIRLYNHNIVLEDKENIITLILSKLQTYEKATYFPKAELTTCLTQLLILQSKEGTNLQLKPDNDLHKQLKTNAIKKELSDAKIKNMKLYIENLQLKEIEVGMKKIGPLYSLSRNSQHQMENSISEKLISKAYNDDQNNNFRSNVEKMGFSNNRLSTQLLRTELDSVEHKRRLYWKHKIEFLNNKPAFYVSKVRGFCSVTDYDGIYSWRQISVTKKNKYKGTQIYSTGLSLHSKGALNFEGIYIAAGYFDKNAKIYNITISLNSVRPKIQLLKTFNATHADCVTSCFIFNTTYAICVDRFGYSYKYNLQALTQEVFYHNKKARFWSGIQTSEGLIVIGALFEGKLHILDEQGQLIHIHQYESTGKVCEIAEIHKNILITADEDSGAYLHDIKDPLHLVSLKLLDQSKIYNSIIVLTSNLGDFAIGGRRRMKGFVDIYHLNIGDSMNMTATLIKSKEDIWSKECNINIIKEIKPRVLLFGGNYACQICLWNYFAWPPEQPLCWENQSNSGIIDFFSFIDYTL